MEQAIQLTPEAIAYGRGAGAERTARARAIHRSEPHGTPRNAEEGDMEAACAELAVAVYLGVEWQAQTDPDKGGDVLNIEVRHSLYHSAHLIIYEDDFPHCPFVLVTGEKGQYVLRGWIMGCDAMHPRYQNNPKARNPEDYWVPQSDLEPMEIL